MNILLWILQFLLALHTIFGAVWKFSHSAEQTMPSLAAIPQGIWLTLSVIELLCALALILPVFNRALGTLVPLAASCIALEMVVYILLHLYSGDPAYSPVIYWLIVAVICMFIVYGRLAVKPLQSM